jgi:hypothetical protein
MVGKTPAQTRIMKVPRTTAGLADHPTNETAHLADTPESRLLDLGAW